MTLHFKIPVRSYKLLKSILIFMKAFLFTLILFTQTLFAAELRSWTNTEGKALQASLVDIVTDAKGDVTTAKVRMTTGQMFNLEASKLSSADNDYLKLQATKRAEESKTALLANRKAKWTDDWEAAKAESAETGLPILLFMTGSDWCGYCMQLKGEVFENKVFQKYADQNLVLMVADFPKGIRQSKSLVDQNKKLEAQFPISGYPTIFIVKDDKVIARAGSTGGASAKEYVEKLQAKVGK
jgi:protein disulfide-isomerase